MFEKIFNFFKKNSKNRFLSDASILEDGRILNILSSKLINIELLIPQFIVDEIRKSVSSKNVIKRNRAKRGMDIIAGLKNVKSAQIINKNFREIKDVNAKLIALSKQMKIPIFTADFKLSKTAFISGAAAQNLDDFAKIFKQIYLPGEALMIFLAKEGAQNNQAVGYLDDGTMVIAEDGKKFIGKRAELFLTSVIQSSSGKMLFGKVSDNYIEQINEMYKKSANR
jgi:uncharacterized protein YacL